MRRSLSSPPPAAIMLRFAFVAMALLSAAFFIQRSAAAVQMINLASVELPKIDVGIVVAVLGEFQALYNALDPEPAPYNATKFGRTFTIGALAGHSVAVVTSGIGMTNAAMTTQMLLDTFDVKYLIFQGVAGGVNPALRVGDVVVPKSWFNIHHQKLIRSVPSQRNNKTTRTFYEVGRDFPNKFVTQSDVPIALTAPLPNAPAATDEEAAAVAGIPGVGFYSGFAIPMESEVLIDPSDVFQDFPPTKFYMPVSETLWKIAKQVQAEKLPLLRSAVINGKEMDLGYQPQLVVSPNPGASSSTFLDNKEYRQALYRLFRAQAFEMEGAAFMHVCASAAKECLVIRALSDLAGGEADFVNVVQVFLAFSAKNTAAVTKAILSKLPSA